MSSRELEVVATHNQRFALNTRADPNTSQHRDWAAFVGFVLGDGGVIFPIQGPPYLLVTQVKDDGVTYIDGIVRRLQRQLPHLGLRRKRPTQRNPVYTCICRHQGVVEFFKPMVVGPRSYDPDNDDHVKNYEAHHYHSIADGPQDHDIPLPARRKRGGKWRYIRRWMGDGHAVWLTKIDKFTARAILEGFAAADGLMAHLKRSWGRGGRRPYRISNPPLFDGNLVQVYNSSLPLIEDLSMLAGIGEVHPIPSRVTNLADAGAIGHIGARQINRNATQWMVGMHYRKCVPLRKPLPYLNPRHDGFVYTIVMPSKHCFLARRRVMWDPDVPGQSVRTGETFMKPFLTTGFAPEHPEPPVL
ncbi:uncharacterized protein PFL1_04444 [Pseudozyma flocculosa PF-1]|uniref:Uncharacterized protein n=1 Tax=Pseudozyma flocculosa PF-1 TaxID=1277687 RepID=A0A061H5E6_9BASI|nr:uncharacterized protein PFL1_04444 [Pseudozyma flocculosa PF-1]EPQ28117.1 hypothetical protein PFL1_04444 [Pseudozyma flocculosa PF-1]